MVNVESMVQTLVQCAKHCDECAAACLNEKDVHHLVNCIKLNLVCADYCRACARMVELDSVHTRAAIELCTSVCSTCKEECQQHDHTHYKQCAIVCQECEKLCNEWLSLESVGHEAS